MNSNREIGRGDPIARLSSVYYGPETGWPLQGVDLDIHAGELHVLVGETDSGRALILQMLMGLIRPESGSVTIRGADPTSYAIRQQVGATLFGTHLPGSMRVREIIDLVRVHFDDTLSTDGLLEEFGIGYLADRRAETLDQGEERWTSVALAFAGKPDLVVLDQPTAAMDFDWRLRLWRRLREFTGRGGAAIMSSHFIEETEAFADHITIMVGGRVVTSGTPEEIKKQGNTRRIQVKTDNDLDLGDGCEVRHENGTATIYADDTDATVRQMIQNGVDFTDLRVGHGSLEEAIITLTGNHDE